MQGHRTHGDYHMRLVLTTQFNTANRCDRCDCLLASSTYRGRLVASIMNPFVRTNARSKFTCIKCVRMSKTNTEEIESLLGLSHTEPQKDRQTWISKKCTLDFHSQCFGSSGRTIRTRKKCQCRCHASHGESIH